MSTLYQLVYLPYVSLANVDEIRFGRRASIWNFDRKGAAKIPDPALYARVEALLDMNVDSVVSFRRSAPRQRVRGIGVVSVGATDFHVLDREEQQLVTELRALLFVCCLADNVALSPGNPNAGHFMYTSENFLATYQNFQLDTKYVAESSGVIIPFRRMGYELGEAAFPKPTYVNQPAQFAFDKALYEQLWALRRRRKVLYNRILRASRVFMESYYNTSSLDINARILLQASAFEVLLDLPESGQRKAFKSLIEQYCGEREERVYIYKYEDRGVKRPDRKTIKGIWADRFYTLRNHIIHGNVIRPSEYKFRGAQHHILIAPQFLVLVIKKLIEEVRTACGEGTAFADSIRWTRWENQFNDPPTKEQGFRVERNLLKQWLANTSR